VVDSAHDIANAAFPYLACGDVTVGGGLPARLYRLSFSGELAFEIGVPARFGDALVRAIVEAGAAFGIAPYGTEALGVLRIEKNAGAAIKREHLAFPPVRRKPPRRP
jgi:sarcosine oxidase subunit alpha